MAEETDTRHGNPERAQRRRGYPYTMPETLLNSPAMRRALADRDWGRIFQLVNLRSGASYDVIAAAIGVSKGRVGDYLHRRVTPKGSAVIARIADGLGIPGKLLDLNPFSWELSESDPALPGLLASSPVPDSPTSGETLLRVARAAESSTSDPWEVIELLKRLESSDIDGNTLEIISSAIDRLCRDYPSASAPELHERTQGWLRYVISQLNGRVTLAQHTELVVFAGWLFLLAGCVEYDLGKRQKAEISRMAAMRIGKETGHGEILAWSHEMACWFALTQGKYADVVDFADAGLAAELSHSVAVQLYAQKAKAYARMGNKRMLEKALDDGYVLLDKLPRPEYPEHHFAIDPDKWDFYAMDAYRLSGDDYKASRHAVEVIKLGTRADGSEKSPMRMAEARLTLGVGAARSGELEEAVSIGSRALRAERRSLPSLLMVGRELQGELDQRYPRETATRVFKDGLRMLTIDPGASGSDN